MTVHSTTAAAKLRHVERVGGVVDAESFNRVTWPRSAVRHTAFPMLSDVVQADVAIIGGGYTGLSAALHLAQARDVVLLEAEEPGFGSSGRNAAGYLPIYLDRTPEDVVRTLGPDRGGGLNRMIAESTQLMLDIIKQFEIDADLRPTGILIGGHDDKSEAMLPKLAEMWRQYGSNIETLDRSNTARLTGSSKFRGGTLFKEAGTINPVSYARGLATAAASAGARIFSRSAARQLQREGSRWRVSTQRGVVLAKHVLLATDAYAGIEALWPALEKTYYALPVAMITSRPMPEHVRDFFPGGIPVCDMNKTNHFWFMASPDGRFVASMLPPRTDDLTANQVAKPFDKKLRRIYGDMTPIEWEEFWIGRVAVTAQRVPCVFPLAEQLHAIGGYSGQGITAATAAGREYAKFIQADCREDASLLPFLAPKPVPMRSALPVLLRKVMAPLSQALDGSYS